VHVDRERGAGVGRWGYIAFMGGLKLDSSLLVSYRAGEGRRDGEREGG